MKIKHVFSGKLMKLNDSVLEFFSGERSRATVFCGAAIPEITLEENRCHFERREKSAFARQHGNSRFLTR